MLPQKDLLSDSLRISAAVAQTTKHGDGLVVSWDDQHQSFFHFIWLRDCCYCELCGDSYSSKRFFMPNDVALDVAPSAVDVSSDGHLHVTWAPDGHVSRYDAEWLRQNCYDNETRRQRFHEPVLWDSALQDALPMVSFSTAHNTDRGRMDLYRKLRDFGFVVVADGSPEPGCAEKAARLVGELGDAEYAQVFDLTPTANTLNISHSTCPLPPHTDEPFRHTPPGVNVLGCVRPARDGGSTVLVDGFQLGDCLRKENPEGFALLSGHGQPFQRHHDGQLYRRTRARMFNLDDRGRIVGVRIQPRSAGPMDLPEELVVPFYAAHQHVCRLMLLASNQTELALKAGDSVLIDNHRVLHARTGFADTNRFVQICNVSREDFHDRLRLLAEKLGHPAEASQVLTTGMAW
jgi:gamma-butyrobetaine dioxygenase